MERKVKYEPDYESGFNFLDNEKESMYKPPEERDEEKEKEEDKKILKWISKMVSRGVK